MHNSLPWPTHVLDIANNHGGSYAKACRIIDAHSYLALTHGADAAIKFQYRDNARFKHGDEAYNVKFKEAWMAWDQHHSLALYAKKSGLKTACTAFDPSAAEMMSMSGYDYAKVASCSARDWRTIEAISELGLPTIFSTAALSYDEIDDLVSFAEHKGLLYMLMHCVAIYPAPLETLNLSKIAELRRRYPHINIGWSTHEAPRENSVQMAYAYGARTFECHVALTDNANAYSKRPEDAALWYTHWQEASEMGEYHGDTVGKERAALARVERKEVDAPKHIHPLKKYIHRTKASLNIAGVPISPDFTVEFSHHYGLGRFELWGAVLITCVNRDYCKKLIVVQQGQSHPTHYHKVKEETFQVLHGRISLTIEDRTRILEPGDMVTVQPGQWHSFTGFVDHTVFEEISTRAIEGDSVYRDPLVTANKERKTAVKNWGRFEI